MEKQREKFLKAYADIPESLRKEIIAVIEGKTYTWDVVFFEVKENTEFSKKLLKTLEETGIL